jgi:hypothetical protein
MLLYDQSTGGIHKKYQTVYRHVCNLLQHQIMYVKHNIYKNIIILYSLLLSNLVSCVVIS